MHPKTWFAAVKEEEDEKKKMKGEGR